MDDRKLPSIDAENLKELLENEFEQCIVDVTQAVNDGRAGSVIDDSEEPVRQAMGRFRQQVFEKAIQMKINAAQAAFSPRENPKIKRKYRHKGKQKVSRDTVNGNICFERIRWWSREHGVDDTIDRLIGAVADTVSVGVRQMCCRVAISQQGFSKGAEHLYNLAQVKISPERLRMISETEGQRVLLLQRKGCIDPDLNAQNSKAAPDGPSRVYTGVDGVMVPMITQEEKQKRRQKRGPKPKGSRRRRMHAGADNAYKEFKIATFYDESNEHRHVTATAGDHKVLGKLVRRQAGCLKLNEFDEKVAIADGAEWIHRQLQINVPILDAFILDFYHFSEHIWEVANQCFGINSDDAGKFAEDLLHIARHEGITDVLVKLEQLRKEVRSQNKRKALRELLKYIGKRAGQCDYPGFREKGWQIGSGPTEAMCKVLTYRLKGAGMRWDRQGAEPIMALIALEQSNIWNRYWNRQKVAA